MPTVTVSKLIDRAKATADMRDNFVTPVQWTTWASQERLSLDLFLARSGWMLPLADFNIAVTGSENGAFSVNPTGGVMAIVCVYQYDSAGRMRLLKYQDAVTFLRQVPGSTVRPMGHSSYYRSAWTGDSLTLNLYPEPAVGETYRVVYLPHPKQLVLSLTETSPIISATTASGVVNRDGMVVYASWHEAGAAGNGHTITFTADPGQSSGSGTWTDGANATYLYYPYLPPSVATFESAVSGSAFWVINAAQTTGNIQYDEVLTAGGGADEVPAVYGNWEETSVSYPMGWEERIILGMARRALMKEESDTRGVDSEIGLWESRIEEACWDRVITASPAVRNVDISTYGWTDRLSLPPVGFWTWP